MRACWSTLLRAGRRFAGLIFVGIFLTAPPIAGCGKPTEEEATPVATPVGSPATFDPAEASALEERRVALRAQMKALVGDLTAAGKYDCCVEAPCNLCAMRAGGCKCGEGLRRGEPVCEECAMMWKRGNGAEPGVDADSVRSFLEAEREMEARAKREGGRTAADPDAMPATAPAPAAACACPGHPQK